MTGLILDSKNTILPEDPAISPASCQLCPSWDALSVMYITDSEGRLVTCMFWEGEKRRASNQLITFTRFLVRPCRSSIVTCRRPRSIKPARSNSRAAFVMVGL